MKYKTLLKKLNLKQKDFDDIKESVAKAEEKTTGEIALAVTAESAHYSYWELLASNIFAAIVLIVLLSFSDKIHDIYRVLYWQNEPVWILPAFFVISCFAAIVYFPLLYASYTNRFLVIYGEFKINAFRTCNEA